MKIAEKENNPNAALRVASKWEDAMAVSEPLLYRADSGHILLIANSITRSSCRY